MQPLSRLQYRRSPWRMAIAAIATAAVAAPSAAHASFPGRNGRIAVAVYWGRIASITPQGTAWRTLIDCWSPTIKCGAPDWSPDGQNLLFLWGGPGVMPADGIGPDRSRVKFVPLATQPRFGDAKPSFAPDGRHFAYTRERRGQSEIWRANVDGDEDRRLAAGLLPRWAPNGRRIAYVGQDGGLWLMNARTGRRIRKIGPTVSSFDWAPDGRRIVYALPRPQPDVFVIGADGKGSPRRLTWTTRWVESAPVWAPNGRKIAFVRRRNHRHWTHYTIWTMTPAGRRTKRIRIHRRTDGLAQRDVMLSWQPR
jgi:Tol biopolymer transport system component